MIAVCPTCRARYRVDTARIPEGGSRLRCTRCQSVFRVAPPRAAEPPAPETAAAPRPEPAPPAPPPEAPARGEAPPPRPGPQVLVAESELSEAKRVADAVRSWGLEPIVVHDGVEAILGIQRLLPCAVVLDAALPKMFGFQVCELMKRNESLRAIPVVLVGAIHHRERYRRPASEYYGADAYVERPHGVDALRAALRRLGLPVPGDQGAPPGDQGAPPGDQGAPPGAGGATPPPEPRPVATPEPEALLAPAPEVAAAPAEPAPGSSRAAAPAEPAPAPERAAAFAEPAPAPERAAALPPGGDRDESLARAERLARIVVSDIILYNPEKFEAGVRDGNVMEALAGELEEGRHLFRERIEERVRESRDFLSDELLRVARQRGMR